MRVPQNKPLQVSTNSLSDSLAAAGSELTAATISSALNTITHCSQQVLTFSLLSPRLLALLSRSLHRSHRTISLALPTAIGLGSHWSAMIVASIVRVTFVAFVAFVLLDFLRDDPDRALEALGFGASELTGSLLSVELLRCQW